VVVAVVVALLSASAATAAVGGAADPTPGSGAPTAAGTGGGIAVPAEVAAAVASGPATVTVSFDPSAGQQALRPASVPGATATARAQAIAAAASSFARSKRDTLDRVGRGIRTTRDFRHLPVQVVQVDDEDALRALAADPHVVGLSLPRTYHLDATPNLELIHQPDAVAHGHTGAGVTVAVLDSGLDLHHSGVGTLFGDSTAGVGSTSCRVKVLSDVEGTGDHDTSEFHGTNVAGVVATVAPAAKLDVYGVFRNTTQGLTAADTDIDAAIDAVLANAGDHNTRAVNMSLASTDAWHTSACSNPSSTPLVNAFTSLVQAGIVPVVAAGNDAYTKPLIGQPQFHPGVSEPACIPGALSVGAVYPQTLSGMNAQYSDCTDSNPVQKQIACFSQTGSLLGVLAPGVEIAAAGVTLTGTSQATPHVAGAVAAILDAKPSASEAELVTAIKGAGPLINDLRPNPDVQRRLLDIDGAAALLAGNGTTTTTASTTTTRATTTTTTRATTTTTTAPPTTPATIHRVNGADRIGTSIAASQSSFPSAHSAQAVVLASSQAFPDGLAGTPLAVKLQAPLLLTDPASVRDDLLTEIQRVLPAGGSIEVLGGTTAIADPVVSALQGAGFQVQRLFGPDRYATATAIADRIGGAQVALLATGLNFPDGLAAGVAAAHAGGVVLFTQGSTQAGATQSWLQAHSGVPVVTVGGPAASAFAGGTHLSGADRYETSVDVAEHFFADPSIAGLASGTVFPDALSGGAHIAELGGPMLLTAPSSLPSTVGTWFRDHADSVTVVEIYGGTTAVAEAVATQVRTATS
jgi:hypothetical protein